MCPEPLPKLAIGLEGKLGLLSRRTPAAPIPLLATTRSSCRSRRVPTAPQQHCPRLEAVEGRHHAVRGAGNGVDMDRSRSGSPVGIATSAELSTTISRRCRIRCSRGVSSRRAIVEDRQPAQPRPRSLRSFARSTSRDDCPLLPLALEPQLHRPRHRLGDALAGQRRQLAHQPVGRGGLDVERHSSSRAVEEECSIGRRTGKAVGQIRGGTAEQ